MVEHGGRLKFARNAHLRAAVNRQGRDVLAFEPDPPTAGRKVGGDHADERRFARAVRANEAADLASLEREVDMIIGDDPAETLAQPFGAKNLNHAHSRCDGGHARSRLLRRL